MLPAVVAECVFVLESFYNHARADIARTMVHFLSSPGIELPDVAAHLDGLNRYSRSKMHFVDCVIASAAAALGLPVATFDSDFKKFPDLMIDLD